MFTLHIQTVSGSIQPEELGQTLMHEHVDSQVPGAFYSGGDSDAVEALIADTLRVLPKHGVGALVDLTGRGRLPADHDPLLPVRVAAEVGLHVIAGFALYKDPWLAEAMEPARDLKESYVRQARVGSEGVRAGVFGEVGTSLDDITANEEAQLIAAAEAHHETGLAILTHCTLGTMALEQAKILRSRDMDLSRVVLGHLDLMPDIDYLSRVLDTGANIGFDTFGKEWFDYLVPDQSGPGGERVKHTYHRSDEDRITALVELCRRGYDSQIVMSCDISGSEAWLNPQTHGRYGYSYLFEVVIPRLRGIGVPDASINRMMVGNPARILAIP